MILRRAALLLGVRTACAFALVLAAAPRTARADDVPHCTASERGTESECDQVETFERPLEDAVILNNSLHVMPRLVSHFVLDGTGDQHTGVGLFAGMAPLSRSQRLRVTIGADLVFGAWHDQERGSVTLEPRVLLGWTPLAPLKGAIAIGPYLTGAIPTWLERGDIAWAVGAGLTARFLGIIQLDVGPEWILDERRLTSSDSGDGHRLSVAGSIDLCLRIGWCYPKPRPKQRRVDLRCAIIHQARLRHDTAQAGRARAPGATPPRASYCTTVDAALAAATAGPPQALEGEEPMATFLRILAVRGEGQLAGELRARHENLSRCVERARKLQRRCLDCTSEYPSDWVTYPIDPHQLAAGLGCIGGLAPQDAECRADELEASESRCGSGSG